MFAAEDRQEMLEAVGVLASRPDGETFWVKPPLFPDAQVGMIGIDNLETVNPYCIADSVDLDNLSIVSGESGTIIDILGKQYRVLSTEPETSGFVAVELGAV